MRQVKVNPSLGLVVVLGTGILAAAQAAQARRQLWRVAS
jgi:hypothetical protein